MFGTFTSPKSKATASPFGMVAVMVGKRAARALGLRRPVRLGSFGGTQPISSHWGSDRGTPVDRHYIEQFLDRHRSDIRGRVLEVMDAKYTARFGIGVSHSDVLDINASNSQANVIVDLADAPELATATYDCVILTQTLQFILAFTDAIRTVQRVLTPNGVLLATIPTVSRIDPKAGKDADYWRLTPAACKALFGEIFGHGNVRVDTYGNVLSAVAFLEGLASEELDNAKLDFADDLFPVLVGVRALKT